MRGNRGSLPGRGGAAYPGACGGEPGENPSGGMWSCGAGGEPGFKAAIRRSGVGAGGTEAGAGAVTRGNVLYPSLLGSMLQYRRMAKKYAPIQLN